MLFDPYKSNYRYSVFIFKDKETKFGLGGVLQGNTCQDGVRSTKDSLVVTPGKEKGRASMIRQRKP